MLKDTSPSSGENVSVGEGTSSGRAVMVGITVKTTIERGDAYLSPEIYNVEVTLLEIVRGEKAWERLASEGISDRPPETGFEYVLALVRLGYFQRGRRIDSEPFQLTEGQFSAVSADGTQEYKLPSTMSQPEPSLIGRIFHPGETHEGWILLRVPEEDKKPLLIFRRKHVEGMYGIWGYVWFQLY